MSRFRRATTFTAAVVMLVVLGAASAVVAEDRSRATAVDQLRIAVIGDQYSSGMKNETVWPILVAERTGWAVANFAQPYAGYDTPGTDGHTFANQVDRALAAGVDVIVLAGGGGDVKSTDAAVAASVREILKKITLSGDVALIVGPTWYRPEIPVSVRRIADTLHKVAEETAVPYLDALNPPWLTAAQMQPDLRSPTDEGQSVLAGRIAQWLGTEVAV